jgi:hypothetical protein
MAEAYSCYDSLKWHLQLGQHDTRVSEDLFGRLHIGHCQVPIRPGHAEPLLVALLVHLEEGDPDGHLGVAHHVAGVHALLCQVGHQGLAMLVSSEPGQERHAGPEARCGHRLRGALATRTDIKRIPLNSGAARRQPRAAG